MERNSILNKKNPLLDSKLRYYIDENYSNHRLTY